MIKIFAEKELSHYLDTRVNQVNQIIENEADDYILNVNESDYVKHKVSESFVEPLNLYSEKIAVSTSEQMIPAESFPPMFNVYAGKSYKKDVLKFHIPFSGCRDLLYCTPNPHLIWTTKVEILSDEICFFIINFSNNKEDIQRVKDDTLSSIIQQSENVNNQVNVYNNSIQDIIKQLFINRKNKIIDKNDLLLSIGVQIKKTTDVLKTFSVPITENKIVISKPIVKDRAFKPEPTLDNQTYYQILSLIHDVGKTFERLPSLYAGKEEEHLRDHFLMMLEPNFKGSATGETFNKTGKTDILLRYEGLNVFIAECKYWKGKKSLLDTISQLLAYLTWRDSKSAVIIFVPNKEFSAVLDTGMAIISEHSNYIEYVDSKDETWFNYIFHLNGDRNRMVKLAMMFYHLPK
jgi:hypothetical protein